MSLGRSSACVLDLGACRAVCASPAGPKHAVQTVRVILTGDCRQGRRAPRAHCQSGSSMQKQGDVRLDTVCSSSALCVRASQHQSHARTTGTTSQTAITLSTRSACRNSMPLPRVSLPLLAAACMATMATE